MTLTPDATNDKITIASSTAWSDVTEKPTATGSKVTGITIADHSTASIIGVGSSTTSVTGVSGSTIASKVTLGTAFSVPNVTAAGSASNWVFENITVPIKNANATSIPNVTAVGSGSASLTMTMDTTDTKKLNISFSHTHTPPTLGTAISITGVQSSTTTASHVKSGGNGTAPTLGTAISIPNVTGVSDVTVPKAAASATTVPIKNSSATTVVTGKSHSITDPGHTHTIS